MLLKKHLAKKVESINNLCYTKLITKSGVSTMVKLFEFEFGHGWDGSAEKPIEENISGPSHDGYIEIGGKIYESSNSPIEDEEWNKHINKMIERGLRNRG